MNILVTGGAGYIGSHTVLVLLDAGHEVTIIDNFSNAKRDIHQQLEKLSAKNIAVYDCDVEDSSELDAIFNKNSFEAVIHFAGLKAVNESVQKPLRYYRVNLDSTLTLLEIMQKYSVKKFIFSSSATVYGSAPVPYREDGPVGQGITNPYGQTKYAIECMLRDLVTSDDSWEIGCLRYFNPIGAHKSGDIGELPQGTPNNLMPFITQVAAGQRENLKVFGDDYDTPDGTCVRDFIHVNDVAEGHLAMTQSLSPGFHAINLGTGKGTSVMELILEFEKVNGVKIPFTVAPKREGDLASFYASVDKAKKELNWEARYSLEDMCRDSWRWQQRNLNFLSPTET